ncbi:MAG: hypothetical protein ACREFZ_03455 [Acetobacteraceae bacterium]
MRVRHGTFALLGALGKKGLEYERLDAFDLTAAMLARFRSKIDARKIKRMNLAQADVLALDALPSSWRGCNPILSTSMPEYVPKDKLVCALSALRLRLAPTGQMFLMIAKCSFEAKLLIEGLWHANSCTRAELRSACEQAGLGNLRFLRFPLRYVVGSTEPTTYVLSTKNS